MAGNFPQSWAPGEPPRHVWQSSDGSSVDPKYFILDSYSGYISVKEGSQRQLLVDRSVIQTQPQLSTRIPKNSTGACMEHKLKYLGEHWNDTTRIANMVIFDSESAKRYSNTDVVLEGHWRNLLEKCIDFNTLRGYIRQFMDNNMECYCKIMTLVGSIQKKDGLMLEIKIPEQAQVLNNWSMFYNSNMSSMYGLRSLLRCFMIMQLQFQELVLELENFLSIDSVEHMEVSSSNNVPNSLREDIPYHGSLQMSREGKQLAYIGQLEGQIEQLKKQLHDNKVLLNEVKVVNLGFKEKVENSDVKCGEAEAKTKKFQEDIYHLRKKLDDVSREKERLQQNSRDHESLKSEFDTQKKKLENAFHERNHYYNKYYDAEKKRQDIEDESRKTNATFFKQMHLKDAEIQRQKLDIDQLHKELVSLKKSKDELLTRLSKLAGAKLTHGNADITDLSDENRPVKIAEKFSELYDNEWTDSLEELVSRTSSEEKAIEINLDIVSAAYEFCSEISEQHEKKLMHSLAHLPHIEMEPEENQTDVGETPANISQAIRKDIEDIRRSIAPQLISVAEERFALIAAKVIQTNLHGPSLQETISGSNVTTENETFALVQVEGLGNYGIVTDPFEDGAHGNGQLPSTKSTIDDLTSLMEQLPSTTTFARRCAHICWLMRIREPKLHMVYNIKNGKGKEYDTELFRHYTRTGKKFNYLVWPALFLYENGPLLGKGVAQPM